jgi:hypothetical protein
MCHAHGGDRETLRRQSQTMAKASEVEALRRAVMQQFDQYVKLNKKIPHLRS